MKIEEFKGMKKYKQGALKRKVKMSKGEPFVPGSLIGRMNKMKGNRKTKVAVMGLI